MQPPTSELNVKFSATFIRSSPWLKMSCTFGKNGRWQCTAERFPLYIGIFALTIIDLGFFLPEGVLSRLLGALWLAITLLFLASALILSIRSLAWNRELWASREWPWFLVALIVPICAMLVGLFGVDWLLCNDESNLQISLGMDLLQNDNAFGVYQSGYRAGYPARQFILAAIPSYLFGHSLELVRLSFFSYFLWAHVAFLAAAGQLLQARKCLYPWIWASLASLAVTLSPYTLLTVRIYEQSSIPICASMFLVAGFLRVLERPSNFNWFWVAWAIGFLPFCHRPALSAWPMSMLCLFVLLFYARYRSFALVAIMAQGSVALVVGMLVLRKNWYEFQHLFVTHDLPLPLAEWREFQLMTHYSGPELSIIPAPLAIASIGLIYYSFKVRDFRFPAIFIWALTSIYSAGRLIGSYPHAADFDARNTLPTLPFVAAGLILFIMKYHAHIGSALETWQKAARLGIVYLVYTGGFLVLLFRSHVDGIHFPSDVERMVFCIDRYVQSGKPLKKIYILPPLPNFTMEDFLPYYAPGATAVFGPPPPGEKEPGYCIIHMTKWAKESDPRPYDVGIQIDPE